jgi:hypothetical protein
MGNLENMVAGLGNTLVLFAEEVRQQMGFEMDNRMYLLAKSVIERAMEVYHLENGRSLAEVHVFNDSHHPLREATEWKIGELYLELSKEDISSVNFSLLVDELYSFTGGIEEFLACQVKEETGWSQPAKNDPLLCYYIAKYP